jgi:protein TonB
LFEIEIITIDLFSINVVNLFQMKRKKEKVPRFDEIIFENRNKEYGAFDLRRHYLPAKIFSTIGGVVLFSIITIILGLISEKPISAEKESVIIILQMDSSIQDPNKIVPEEPERPKADTKTLKYITPEIVDKLDSTDVTLEATAVLDTISNRPVDTEIAPVISPDPVINPEPEPYVFVQEPPQFPGGEKALLKFISDNLKYPEEALRNNLEGRVTLRFVVSADGSVKRIEVMKSVDPALDDEAVRVISLLPTWKPGKQNGKPVPVWFSVPVYFQIKQQ